MDEKKLAQLTTGIMRWRTAIQQLNADIRKLESLKEEAIQALYDAELKRAEMMKEEQEQP